MLFKPELIEKIVRDEKTQTRRPAKCTEAIHRLNGHSPADSIIYLSNGRPKWKVGRDYAVQPGRGRSGRVWYPAENRLWHPKYGLDNRARLLRIRVLELRSEDVRDITHADSIAEGFTTKYGFLQTWCGFYDPPMVRELEACTYDGMVPDHCPLFLGSRPDELYQAWVITFEAVR